LENLAKSFLLFSIILPFVGVCAIFSGLDSLSIENFPTHLFIQNRQDVRIAHFRCGRTIPKHPREKRPFKAGLTKLLKDIPREYLLFAIDFCSDGFQNFNVLTR